MAPSPAVSGVRDPHGDQRGRLVGLWGATARVGSSTARSWSAGIGLAVLAVSIIWTPGGDSFPGAWAFLAVIGTLLVILDQDRAVDGAAPAGMARVLACPPLAGIGRLSYSLYLWHWPVFTFVDYLLVFATPSGRGALKIIVTIGCGWASYAVVEKPLRSRLARPVAGRLAYGAFVVGMIALFTIGLAVRRHCNLNGSIASLRRGGARYGDGPGRPVTVVAGDSTACMFGTTVREVCRETGWTMVMAAVPGMTLLPDPAVRGDDLWTLTESIVSRERPKRVIVSARWTTVLKSPEDTVQLRRCMETMLAFTDRVVVLEQPPILPFEATREGIRQGGRPPFRERPEDAERRREANAVVRSLASERVHVIDLDRYFFDTSGSVRRTDSQGNELFRDQTHLSSRGAKLVAPELRAALQDAP